MGTAIEKGNYVLATKFEDGDPFDPWCVGFYDGLNEKGRHMVTNKQGVPFRLNGFGSVYVITRDLGEWIIHNKGFIEDKRVSFIDLMKTPHSILKLLNC